MNKSPLLLASLICLALQGCGEPAQGELKAWMQQEAKGMRGKVPPLPEITPYPPVAYGARDILVPFSPLKISTVELSSDKGRVLAERPRYPLENFPLEDLRVTGVILRNGVPYALIAPPAPQKPKHVKVGEYMGQNHGLITGITTSGVTVLETTKDTNGAWVEREVIKPVPRQGEAK